MLLLLWLLLHGAVVASAENSCCVTAVLYRDLMLHKSSWISRKQIGTPYVRYSYIVSYLLLYRCLLVVVVVVAVV